MTLTLTKNLAKGKLTSFLRKDSLIGSCYFPPSMAAVWKSEHGSSLSKLLLFLNSKKIYYDLVRVSLPTLSSFLHAQFADLLLCHRVWRHKSSSTQQEQEGGNPDISGQHRIFHSIGPPNHPRCSCTFALFALKVQSLYYCDVLRIEIFCLKCKRTKL